MKLLKFICFLCVLGSVADVRAQWCCIDSTFKIPDKEKKVLRIQVSGALNNDLASPNQSVCGVRVRFDHKFIGDLTMTLISPSGQRVQLIGPIGNSGFSFLSRWDVQFIPCGQISIPDKGFEPRWNNIQPWGVLGQFFNGTYYPSVACLEDFDIGPVNGVWNLEIEDHDKFYDGNIYNVCLLFCDQSGTTCNSCSPNGGYFDTTALSFCIGNDSLKNLNLIKFSNYLPDPGVYGYDYLISKNDTIILRSKQPDLSLFDKGKYTICGVSYLLTDSTLIPQANSGTKLSDFRNQIIANLKGFCAEISKNCLDIEINENSIPTDLNITICQGDTFIINQLPFYIEGNYSIKLINQYGCDSILNLNLKTVILKAIIEDPTDDISCNNLILDLKAENSLRDSNSRITWYTINGNIFDTTDKLNIRVNKEGVYYLIISDGLCQDIDSVLVNKTSEVPTLSVVLDTITCSNPIARIKSFTNLNAPLWEWRNENKDPISFADTLLVHLSGKYTVRVTDSVGCLSEKTIEVPIDTSKPTIKLANIELKCVEDSIQCEWSSVDSLLFYEWTYPDGSNSLVRKPIIRDTGIYILRVQGLNGCPALDSFRLYKQSTKLKVILDPDIITCKDSTYRIYTTFNGTFKSLNWSGPNQFNSKELDAVITKSGTYKIEILDWDDCVLMDSVNVLEDKQELSAILTSGKLNCSSDSVQIKIQIIQDSSLLDSVLWTGVNFESRNLEPWIKESGWYYLSLLSRNGCRSLDSIFVESDIDKPILDITSGVLNCYNDTVQIIAKSNQSVRYEWKTPASAVILDSVIIAKEPGVYEVSITASNGCQNVKSVIIMQDTVRPFSGITTDTLTCHNKTLKLNLNNKARIDSVRWIGPNTFKSDSIEPVISVPGTYIISAYNLINGCSQNDTVNVPIDTIRPTVTIALDSITCSKSQASIELISPDPISNIEWRLPNGDTVFAIAFKSEFLGTYFLKVTGKNGCITSDTIHVIASKEKPVLQLQSDTITCIKDSARILAQNPDPNIRYLIISPNLDQDTVDSKYVSQAGWYTFIAKNSADCITIDSIEVISRTDKPMIIFSDSLFNCNNKDSASLFVKNDLPGHLYTWTLPDGSSSNFKNLMFPKSGKYLLHLINRYGCDVWDSINIQFDTLPNVVGLTFDSLTCIKDSASIVILSSDPNLVSEWRHQDTSFSAIMGHVNVTKSGAYHIRFIGSNYCFSDTLINIFLDTVAPEIQALNLKLTCKDSIINLNPLILGSSDLYYWFYKNQIIDSTNQLSVNESGTYTLRAINSGNGCSDEETFFVDMDTLKPSGQIFQLDSINCNGDPIRLEWNSLGAQRKYEFQWSTATGNIISGKDINIVKVSNGAVYQIIVKDSANGCITSESYILNHTIDSLSGLQFNLTQDPCDTFVPIELKVLGMLSGNPPYEFSIDGIHYSRNNEFQDLKTGINMIYIKDRYGCTYDSIIFVPTITPLSIMGEQDTLVLSGSPVLLRAISNKDTSSIYKIQWIPGDYLSCNNCWQTISKPNQNIEYTILVEDSLGCKAEDKIQVLVFNEFKVFAPNSFSPNGDLINDIFEWTFDAQQVNHLNLQIFDRWGGRVYKYSGQSTHVTWDGKFNNQLLTAGVYVYKLDLQLTNGFQLSQYGEINLIR